MLIIPYCIISKDQTSFSSDDISNAGTELTGCAFKLYMFLQMQEEQKFLYERTTFIKKYGSNINTANRAFTELVELGFLQEKETSNYIFYNKRVQNV